MNGTAGLEGPNLAQGSIVGALRPGLVEGEAIDIFLHGGVEEGITITAHERRLATAQETEIPGGVENHVDLEPLGLALRLNLVDEGIAEGFEVRVRAGGDDEMSGGEAMCG